MKDIATNMQECLKLIKDNGTGFQTYMYTCTCIFMKKSPAMIIGQHKAMRVSYRIFLGGDCMGVGRAKRMGVWGHAPPGKV